MRKETPTTHTLDFEKQINCIDICRNDFAYNLVSMGFDTHISFGLVSFPEETEIFEWEHLKDIDLDVPVFVTCFSPDTSLVTVPKNITLCAAFNDFELRIFRTDLNKSNTVQVLSGHKSYINDITWVCNGEYLASVSDDQSCKIWNTESNYEKVNTFCLASAGMAVKWHPEDPNKILIAEKRGIIHLYNVRSQQAIVSVESPKVPLISADWAINNRLYITALAAGDIITWDLSRPFTPADVKQVHEDCGRIIRLSPSSSELVVASIGRPETTLKVFSAKSTVPILETSIKVYGGLAWHHRLPYLCAASDRKLLFWKLQMK